MLAALGVYQEGVAKNVVNGKPVVRIRQVKFCQTELTQRFSRPHTYMSIQLSVSATPPGHRHQLYSFHNCIVYINSKYQVVPGKKWAPVQMILCVKVLDWAELIFALPRLKDSFASGKQCEENQQSQVVFQVSFQVDDPSPVSTNINPVSIAHSDRSCSRSKKISVQKQIGRGLQPDSNYLPPSAFAYFWT
jgi:hypothetical protein